MKSVTIAIFIVFLLSFISLFAPPAEIVNETKVGLAAQEIIDNWNDYLLKKFSKEKGSNLLETAGEVFFTTVDRAVQEHSLKPADIGDLLGHIARSIEIEGFMFWDLPSRIKRILEERGISNSPYNAKIKFGAIRRLIDTMITNPNAVGWGEIFSLYISNINDLANHEIELQKECRRLIIEAARRPELGVAMGEGFDLAYKIIKEEPAFSEAEFDMLMRFFEEELLARGIFSQEINDRIAENLDTVRELVRDKMGRFINDLQLSPPEPITPEILSERFMEAFDDARLNGRLTNIEFQLLLARMIDPLQQINPLSILGLVQQDLLETKEFDTELFTEMTLANLLQRVARIREVLILDFWIGVFRYYAYEISLGRTKFISAETFQDSIRDLCKGKVTDHMRLGFEVVVEDPNVSAQHIRDLGAKLASEGIELAKKEARSGSGRDIGVAARVMQRDVQAFCSRAIQTRLNNTEKVRGLRERAEKGDIEAAKELLRLEKESIARSIKRTERRVRR